MAKIKVTNKEVCENSLIFTRGNILISKATGNIVLVTDGKSTPDEFPGVLLKKGSSNEIDGDYRTSRTKSVFIQFDGKLELYNE